MIISRPTFRTGLATSPRQSAYPHLWRSLRGIWVPSLGPQNILWDWSDLRAHGTMHASMTPDDWIITDEGYALDFDGADDVVTVGYMQNFGLAFTNNTTCMLRFRSSIAGTPNDKFFGVTNTGTNFVVNMSLSASVNGDIQIYMRGQQADSSALIWFRTTAGGWADGMWHHVAWTKQSNSLSGQALYVDGVSQSLTDIDTTGFTTGGNFGFSMALGAMNNRGVIEEHIDADLDDVRFYSRALSASEVFSSSRGASPLCLADAIPFEKRVASATYHYHRRQMEMI